MPFIPNTPESLLARSDSKNPDATCRGITSGGRPCRRPLNSSSPGSSPLPPRSKASKPRVDDPSDPDLYCWQHRDQASVPAKSSPGPRRDPTPILEGRESLETLIDRLGIVEAQRQGRVPANYVAKRREDRHNEKISQSSDLETPKPKVKSEKTFCCCFTIPVFEEREERPTRPKPTPVQGAPAPPASAKLTSNQQHLAPSSGSRPGAIPPKPSSAHSHMSQTSQYLSLIPATASPQTASQLMAELAKPISPQDEPGYIYIFWLTPESQPSAPPVEAARSLLSPPARSDMRQRRTSDVVESFANKTKKAGSSKKTMLLKVGRASNVQRRLNEWTRQCGYDLSLIRYYPYISSSQPSTPRKMPHSHKVERLIHIELAGAGLRVSDKGTCDACGKAHREWFEVDASRNGISMIDEVVRRWSDWDESRG
ncbi:meiotically up-regulated gene 113-domain-containing protein [Xylariaceae sp. FL0662B]|nr:meiotically up-regulated gene 113-domain-containing protein [Xylariaceae sp. FL0662B]